MRRNLCAAVAATLLSLPLPAAAQHGHHHAPAEDEPARALRFGAHAVPLLTHVTPILQGRGLTEGYLTQPTLLGEASLLRGLLSARATISLEALTIDRGELGAGAYGEGYVDRRHPHTYLHEFVLTAAGDVGPATASATVGRGFVPFGTDDPMMRPFVKFPVNHHLGQILERLVVIGGVRAGPVMIEGALFNGNEPFDAKDLGSLDRFGDSWAARATVMPLRGLELQASRAAVTSPEMPSGFGTDQAKWSASARYAAPTRAGSVYALGEWKRTTELDRGREMYSFGSVLAEIALSRGGWTPALRIEHTERPEEVRTYSQFRTVWPHGGGNHGMGLTEWTTVSARIERSLGIGRFHVAPFVEASIADVREVQGGVFEPEAMYGGRRIRTFNMGARLAAGWHPVRMGRYGVADDNQAGGRTGVW